VSERLLCLLVEFVHRKCVCCGKYRNFCIAVCVLYVVCMLVVYCTAERAAGGMKESGWDRLRLKYSADWPLHVLFTTSVLDRYWDIVSCHRITLLSSTCNIYFKSRLCIKEYTVSNFFREITVVDTVSVCSTALLYTHCDVIMQVNFGYH